MQPNTQILQQYFETYNQQIQQVKAIRTPQLINTQGSLETITKSIITQLTTKPKTWKDHYTHHPIAEFANQVLSYFLKTNQVPNYNIKEIIQSAKNQLPYRVGKALKQKVSELKGMGKNPR